MHRRQFQEHITFPFLRRTLAEAVLAIGIICFGTPTYGQNLGGISEKELTMLPEYCHYTPGWRDQLPFARSNPTRAAQLDGILGTTYSHLHHYCKGLAFVNRANYSFQQKGENAPRRLLTLALAEFQYVIDRSDRNFILLPEILSKKGQNLIRLGKSLQGLDELKKAIELKPDYWPPYAYISDYYMTNKDYGNARTWLEKALSIDPQSTMLRERKDALDNRKDSKPIKLN